MSKPETNTQYPSNIPLRKDGQPDMRFKIAREYVAQNNSSSIDESQLQNSSEPQKPNQKFIPKKQSSSPKPSDLITPIKPTTDIPPPPMNESTLQSDPLIHSPHPNTNQRKTSPSPQNKKKTDLPLKKTEFDDSGRIDEKKDTKEAKDSKEAEIKKQSEINKQIEQLKKEGDMIILIQDEFVYDQCEAVKQGLIILNEDNTINPQSPLIGSGKIGITDEGKLDWTFPIMQYIDDRSKDPKPGDFRYKYGQVKFRKQKQKEGFDLSGQDAAHVIDTEFFFALLKKKPGQRSSDAELKASVVYLSEQMNLKPARENRSTDRNNNRRILELVEGKGQLTRELEIVIREKLDAIHVLQDQKKTTPDIDWMENELQKLLLKDKLP